MGIKERIIEKHKEEFEFEPDYAYERMLDIAIEECRNEVYAEIKRKLKNGDLKVGRFTKCILPTKEYNGRKHIQDSIFNLTNATMRVFEKEHIKIFPDNPVLKTSLAKRLAGQTLSHFEKYDNYIRKDERNKTLQEVMKEIEKLDKKIKILSDYENETYFVEDLVKDWLELKKRLGKDG